MTGFQRTGNAGTRLRALAAAGFMLAGAACGRDASLAQLTEARRLSADLLEGFARAADSSNRAVMADRDGAASGFADEAARSTQAVQQDVDALAPLLRALRYTDESRLLEEFRGRFQEYRTLDRTILELAVEGTNLKAQRLSFGAGQTAADAVRDVLGPLAPRDAAERWHVEALVATAVMRVREIQVLQAPHIAEADDAAMTRMETTMAAAAAGARAAVAALAPVVDAASRPRLAEAATAVDRFMTLNADIVALSRRNTNVRSLALSLNQKRLIAAAGHDSLKAIADALATRGFMATR